MMAALAHFGLAFFAFGGVTAVLLLIAYLAFEAQLERAVLTFAAMSFTGALLLFVTSHQLPVREVAVMPNEPPAVTAPGGH